jgi:hypothetical protein
MAVTDFMHNLAPFLVIAAFALGTIGLSLGGSLFAW